MELGGEKSDRASSWPSKYMRQLVAASGASAAAGGEAGGDGERETCGGGWRLVHASLLKKNYREIIKFDRETSDKRSLVTVITLFYLRAGLTQLYGVYYCIPPHGR